MDDGPVARGVLIEKLAPPTGVTVVGQAGNGAEALAKIAVLAPDLVLLDFAHARHDRYGDVAKGSSVDISVTAHGQYVREALGWRRDVLPDERALLEGDRERPVALGPFCAALEEVFPAHFQPASDPAQAAGENSLGIHCRRSDTEPMRRLAIYAVCVLSFGCYQQGVCQSLGNAGTISGMVTDPSGAAVPKAAVSIVNRITNYRQAATTDSTGAFRFGNVPPNPYHLEVSATGFALSDKDVDVRGAVPIDLKVVLALAGSRQQVTVEAAGADLLENVPYAHNDLDTKTLDKLPISSPGSGSSELLDRNEIVSLVPGLQVIDHCERPVRNRGVLEFVGRKPRDELSF